MKITYCMYFYPINTYLSFFGLSSSGIISLADLVVWSRICRAECTRDFSKAVSVP